MQTSLVHQLRETFTRLRPLLSHQKTVIACWAELFQSDPGSALEGILVLRRAVARLKEQITLNPNLDEDGKSVAIEIVAGFDAFLEPTNFHASSQGWETRLARDRLGGLSILAASFQQTYPVGTLAENDRADLSGMVNDLLRAVDEAEITEELRTVLRRSASLMAFALTNVDLLGLDGVYAVLADALMTAHRTERSLQPEAPGAADAETGQSGILRMFKTMCRRLLKAADAADKVSKGVKAAEAIGTTVVGLLPFGK